ncbi:MAG: hypothetical protein OXH23_17725 [bacterium]|nr:hypothetical protein [bacterium]
MSSHAQVDVEHLLDNPEPRKTWPSAAFLAFTDLRVMRADLSALALMTALDRAASSPPRDLTSAFLAIFDSMPGRIERPEPLEDFWVVARRNFTSIRDELMEELCHDLPPGTIPGGE